MPLPPTPMRLVHHALLATVVVLTACDDTASPAAVSTSAHASSAAGVEQVSELWEGGPFTFDPDGNGSCITEPVTVTFRTSFLATVVTTADGRREIESIHYGERGSSGTGVLSGRTYRVVGGQQEHFSDGLTEGYGAGTANLVLHQRWVGPLANFIIEARFGFTITQDGELRVERFDLSRSCQ